MFERWKTRYENGWATDEHLQRLVTLNVLTQAEFDSIVAE